MMMGRPSPSRVTPRNRKLPEEGIIDEATKTRIDGLRKEVSDQRVAELPPSIAVKVDLMHSPLPEIERWFRARNL